jgi:hypothetical protein
MRLAAELARLRRSSWAWLALVGLVPSLAAGKVYHRKYHLMIDANHAEEILAGIALSPRLDHDDWLGIISYHRDEEYVVKSGDTLWGISKKMFGNPFLWRKLWQVNNFLTNPHELTAGRILAYYREGAEAEPIRIPLIKLTPGLGFGADLDSDAVIHRLKKNQFRPLVFVVAEDEILGELTGAYSANTRLAELTEMYVQLNGEKLPTAGTHYGIVHVLRELDDKGPDGNTVIGKLVRLVGEINILYAGEAHAKAELRKHFGIIERGDKLIAVSKVVATDAYINPPENMRLRIVRGDEDTQYFGQGQTVVLDKGSADGVRQGFIFRVLRDEDPATETTDNVEPDSKGEVQVVYTSELSSIGFIIRNKDPLTIGDELIPAQKFPDAPPPPSRSVETIELDR